MPRWRANAMKMCEKSWQTPRRACSASSIRESTRVACGLYSNRVYISIISPRSVDNGSEPRARPMVRASSKSAWVVSANRLGACFRLVLPQLRQRRGEQVLDERLPGGPGRPGGGDHLAVGGVREV